ncbi:SDR family oxidoreductase [Paraburkholderia xenovorans]|uniref:Short-chain dehydrogenase/reductase n=1 Tax=Paraburkholderia xenovorans (strain LB400) TaxID=266265 RepID=Q13I69_PARXL|nr:SDR family oxidoreductase [Paraburkholderia xenovorans]ABE36220.1 Putative short-chain dehydrogenase/reductase [Paraburkholderia xenovorans LB400]
MNELTDTLIAITGGGSGLGEACAELLAPRVAELALIDRDPDSLASVRARLSGLCEISVHACDIANSDDVSTTFNRIERESRVVSTLINCAGMNVKDRHFGELTPDGWNQVIAVNLSGMYYCCQAVLSGMRRQQRGTIINVSSWAGRHAGFFTGPAYNASKRGVLALTESINLEEGINNVRATAVVPEAMATPMIRKIPNPPSEEAIAKMMRPLDVARMIDLIISLPQEMCVNEVVMSPTWNLSYLGAYETAIDRMV